MTPTATLTMPPAVEDQERQHLATIRRVKQRLGARLLILGHHYQRDPIIEVADVTGDSYELSRRAAAAEAEFIVFCGVHFMAESARVLARPHQRVILPDLKAGCSMADMATSDQVVEAWEDLEAMGLAAGTLPITYVNSEAAVKAFCGERGGAVCTSANCRQVLEWAFARAERVFFFPDQHLGRNTAVTMGVPLERILLWNQFERAGGVDAAAVRRATVLLWRGHCSVHGHFTPQHVAMMRQLYPGIKVLVHPEVTFEVFREADAWGSTNGIIRTVRESPPGSQWAIGTEQHLVGRLAQQHPDKRIVFLAPYICQCSTMNRITPKDLATVLAALDDGCVMNEILVSEDVARWARVALDRMLSIASQNTHPSAGPPSLSPSPC